MTSPVTIPDLVRAWGARAASLRLAPGERADVELAAFQRLGSRVWGAFRPIDAEAILDALEAGARLRRPIFVLSEYRGLPCLTVDPDGRAENFRTIAERFEEVARLAAETALVAAIERTHAAEGISYERCAARFGISARHLHRLRRRCQDSPSRVTSTLASRPDNRDTRPPVGGTAA